MSEAPRARAKRAERTIARLLGGERVKKPGQRAPDVVSEWFEAEVKDYAKAPEVPYRELQKLRMSTPRDKLALFIYKRPEWKGWVVCCLLSDFREWWGAFRLPQEEEH